MLNSALKNVFLHSAAQMQLYVHHISYSHSSVAKLNKNHLLHVPLYTEVDSADSRRVYTLILRQEILQIA